MSTTTDLSKFGYRELKMLEQLLRALREQGLPQDFNDDGVHPMMNSSSGYIFLTNEDHQVAMMNRNKLESFYSCPECGHEGFKEEFDAQSDCEECKEIATR
jgi:hypothetical protein